jgi:hypothetical protein
VAAANIHVLVVSNHVSGLSGRAGPCLDSNVTSFHLCVSLYIRGSQMRSWELDHIIPGRREIHPETDTDTTRE